MSWVLRFVVGQVMVDHPAPLSLGLRPASIRWSTVHHASQGLEPSECWDFMTLGTKSSASRGHQPSLRVPTEAAMPRDGDELHRSVVIDQEDMITKDQGFRNRPHKP
jgi:hypothetical protein